MQKNARDVVVVRVSEQGDREDENFHSPRAQLARAKLWSEDQGNRVVDAFEEIDVSGKLPLVHAAGAAEGDRDGGGRRGRSHRGRVLRPAGALAEGAARGDRACRAGGRRDLRDRPRQADQRYGGDADEQQHDGRGVPVLRRGDRREGRSRPGARGGARCAAQLQDLARLRARRGRRAGRGAPQGPGRRAGVQAP